MAYIQISNIDGTPPFQFYVCDYGGNNCELVQTEYDPIYWPINVYVPSTFYGIQSFMLKIVDSNLCETMTIYNCPTPTQTPTNTSTPTPAPSAGCCTPFTNLELPGGNVFLNGVTLTFSSTQPSGLSIFTLPNIMSPACLPQQQLINCLTTVGNNFQDWNYTINFSQPVNNVKIQIINYSSSSIFDHQEKITFTTNTNVPTIFNCDGCNVLVENNSIISNPVPLGGISNGSGTFIISTTNPFNSLTLTPSMLGTNPQGYIVSVFIRICDLTSTPTSTPTPTPTS